MNRRHLLAWLGGAVAMGLLGGPLASRALRRSSRGELVRVGGPNGPLIRVIPLDERAITVGRHLAG